MFLRYRKDYFIDTYKNIDERNRAVIHSALDIVNHFEYIRNDNFIIERLYGFILCIFSASFHI